MAIALSRVGYSIDKLVYRSNGPSPAVLERIEGSPEALRFDELSFLDSDLVLITTADTDLDKVAALAAPKVGERSALLHTSGALSSELLEPAAHRGISTGSMHPLVSVSDPLIGSDSFAGAYFCVEGGERAVAAAEEAVTALGGTAFSIETRLKPLYHASAVLASGHITSLFATAVETLSNCGISGPKAKEILLPLLESSVGNLSKQSIPAALTGPFARTDLEAIERHLAAFDLAALKDEKRVYLELGLEALQLAESNGGDAGKIGRIRDLIKLALAAAK